MKRLLVAVLDLYRLALRPFLPPACRFYPSCGDYAREAVTTHGALKGAALAARRVARCHPFHAGGIDLVPAPRS
ncbi:MAG: membrane protein insertion efficiency factor YidD [Elusimicrobia bacterium]|nr:membrane protein insertion efficiency factor YidD [Elusimicrobiota bacterium]